MKTKTTNSTENNMGRRKFNKNIRYMGLSFDQWSYMIAIAKNEPENSDQAIPFLIDWKDTWGDYPTEESSIIGVDRPKNDEATTRLFENEYHTLLEVAPHLSKINF